MSPVNWLDIVDIQAWPLFMLQSDDGPTRKKQKTASQKKAMKSTVASLLHMEGKVISRAITYAATLVSCSIISNGSFYNFIIDSSGSNKQDSESLLK